MPVASAADVYKAYRDGLLAALDRAGVAVSCALAGLESKRCGDRKKRESEEGERRKAREHLGYGLRAESWDDLESYLLEDRGRILTALLYPAG